MGNTAYHCKHIHCKDPTCNGHGGIHQPTRQYFIHINPNISAEDYKEQLKHHVTQVIRFDKSIWSFIVEATDDQIQKLITPRPYGVVSIRFNSWVYDKIKYPEGYLYKAD